VKHQEVGLQYSFEDPPRIDGTRTRGICDAGTVAHQDAGHDTRALSVGRRQPVAQRDLAHFLQNRPDLHLGESDGAILRHHFADLGLELTRREDTEAPTRAQELESLVDGEFPLSGPLGPGRLPVAPQSFAIGETVRVKNKFVSCRTPQQ